MEGDRQAQDFETMLRVRLERHRGLLSERACRGFDPERASAFIEGALSTSDTRRYEEHLTGCLTCRQAVIELNRLPLAEPVQVPSLPSGVESGWFKTFLNSLRSAPFQWAGAAAAMAGVAIALSMFMIPRQSVRLSEALSSNSSPAHSVPVVQATPAPESGQQVASLAGDAISPTSSKSNSVPLSENGQVTNQRGLVSQPVLPKTESLDLIFGRPNRQIAQLSPSVSAGNAPQFNVPYNAPSVAPQLVPQIGPQITPQSVQAIPPSPQAVQEQTELMRVDSITVQSKDQAQRLAGRDSSGDQRKLASGALAFVPRSGFLKSPTPTPTPNIADEDIRAMTKKVNDKTFRLERGKWVDQQFSRGGFAYRRIEIDRGSEEYKKVLSEIPSLKVFFDLAPVIVVWDLKVYVVK